MISANNKVVVFARDIPKSGDERTKSIFEQFSIGTILPFSEKQINDIIGKTVIENKACLSLLSNTMFLAMYLMFLEDRDSERYISELSTETAFLNRYFSSLYTEKNYTDDYRSKYIFDLVKLGKCIYNQFKNEDRTLMHKSTNKLRINEDEIAKELQQIFYVKDNVLYSTHSKYSNYAVSLYLKNELVEAITDEKYAAVVFERFFTVDLSYSTSQNASEFFYYTGQNLGKECVTNESINSIKKLFRILFKRTKKKISVCRNIVTTVLGISNDILSEQYCVLSILQYCLKKEYFFEEITCLKKIILGKGLRYIGETAFWHFNTLESISFGENIKTIPPAAFVGCDNLKSIEVNSNNKYLISYNNCVINKRTKKMLLGCKNSVIRFEHIKSIGCGAFCGSNLGNSIIAVPNEIAINLESTDNVISTGVNEFDYIYGCGYRVIYTPSTQYIVNSYNLEKHNASIQDLLNGKSIFGSVLGESFEENQLFGTMNNEIMNLSLIAECCEGIEYDEIDEDLKDEYCAKNRRAKRRFIWHDTAEDQSWDYGEATYIRKRDKKKTNLSLFFIILTNLIAFGAIWFGTETDGFLSTFFVLLEGRIGIVFSCVVSLLLVLASFVVNCLIALFLSKTAIKKKDKGAFLILKKFQKWLKEQKNINMYFYYDV